MLQRHLKTHRAACPTDKTFVDLPPPPPSPVPPPPESHSERLMCDLCTKSFASQKMLKRHRQVIHHTSGVDGVIHTMFISMTCLLFPVLFQLPVPRGKSRHVNTWIHMYDMDPFVRLCGNKVGEKKVYGVFFPFLSAR